MKMFQNVPIENKGRGSFFFISIAVLLKAKRLRLLIPGFLGSDEKKRWM